MNRDTIRIAGAGLSGLSAAIGLARQGHQVDVFEKNADSGESRRGHWDAIENWTTQEDVLELVRLQDCHFERSEESRYAAASSRTIA